jgi:hypothetical protein
MEFRCGSGNLQLKADGRVLHACFERGSANNYLVINCDFDHVTTMTHGCHLSWYSNEYNT